MSDFFFYATIALFAIAFVQSFFKHGLNSQRRIYWSCACLAVVTGFLSAYPDGKKGIAISLFVSAVSIVIAFAYTPYLRIGGKTYALTVPNIERNSDTASNTVATDRERDPTPNSYSGLMTATTMWWVLVPLLLISSVNIYAFASGDGEWWVAAIGMAFVVFLGIATGYGDASWGYPIARGQRAQFIILAVITLGTFTVLYLAAYAAGRRRPMRSKHSLEYRARPDSRERFSK